jgi:hypothetical protein
MARGVERNDTLYVPQKYADPGAVHEYKALDRFLTDPAVPRSTDREDFSVLLAREGWFEFQVLPATYSAHLYQTTRDPEDLRTAEVLRDHRTRSYEQIRHFYAKNQGGHDDAWLNFIAGGYPTYPEEILEHNLFQVEERLEMMAKDTEDPAGYDNAYLQRRNPITCEALVQLTMGGPLPLYNGGLLQVAVRHFDAQRRRPGLPEDAAALVRRVDESSVDLTLANTSQTSRREIIVQAGTYGEHEFTDLRYGPPGSTPDRTSCKAGHLRVTLEPGAVLDLVLGLARFRRRPSYRLPWS